MTRECNKFTNTRQSDVTILTFSLQSERLEWASVSPGLHPWCGGNKSTCSVHQAEVRGLQGRH